MPVEFSAWRHHEPSHFGVFSNGFADLSDEWLLVGLNLGIVTHAQDHVNWQLILDILVSYIHSFQIRISRFHLFVVWIVN